MILNTKTTLPRTINRAHSVDLASGGTLIAAPGAGKTITIVDIINADESNKLILREAGAGGAILAYLPPATAISLNCPVETAENVLVQAATSTNVTVTYFVG